MSDLWLYSTLPLISAVACVVVKFYWKEFKPHFSIPFFSG